MVRHRSGDRPAPLPLCRTIRAKVELSLEAATARRLDARPRTDARNVAISANGGVTVDDADTGQQLSVVKFANPEGLVKEGSVLVRATPSAGRARAAAPNIEMATLESSNASALGGMTSLVQASREFEMLTKVIEAFSQVEQRVAQDVARK